MKFGDLVANQSSLVVHGKWTEWISDTNGVVLISRSKPICASICS